MPSYDMRSECPIELQHGRRHHYEATLSSAEVHSYLCSTFLRPVSFNVPYSYFTLFVELTNRIDATIISVNPLHMLKEKLYEMSSNICVSDLILH